MKWLCTLVFLGAIMWWAVYLTLRGTDSLPLWARTTITTIWLLSATAAGRRSRR